MKLQPDNPGGLNTFTAYGEGYVSVNGIRHNCNLAVLPGRLIPDWTQATFATLGVADFELLASLDQLIANIQTTTHRIWARGDDDNGDHDDDHDDGDDDRESDDHAEVGP